jgi:hypothetical protein
VGDVVAQLDQNKCPLGWDIQSHYFVDPPFFPQYQQFVAAAAARYPQAIFEATNEPDIVALNRPQFSVPASQAADQACALYDAVKSITPDAFVLSSGLFDPPYIDGYLARVAALGTRCHDAFSYHFYPYPITSFGANSSFAVALANIRSARAEHGDDTDFWITEVGFSTSDLNAPISSAEQKDAVRVVYNRLTTMCDVNAIFFHTLRDSPFMNNGANTATNREYGFGLFAEDWSAKGGGCFLMERRGMPAPECPL